ncbi:hypothetical protein K439DRAFT_1399345 [Ramaria rubella]|nr:hypothetical protein K439DRAFT_1399345 [Ramaria rubella]
MELQLSECTANIRLKPHFRYPSVQSFVNLSVSHPTHGKIAWLGGLRINREPCRLGSRFLQVFDEDSNEIAEFSRTMFNKFGFLKRTLIDNPHLRGSGCWGDEMDYGILIYIVDMSVEFKFRRCGVGSWMLQQLLSSGHLPDDGFLVCWPSPSGTDVTLKAAGHTQPQRVFEELQEAQIRFFRKNHFRRVGRTSFFAFSPNPDHPSRGLPMHADAPNRTQVFETSLEAQSVDLDARPDCRTQTRQISLQSAINDTNDESIAHIIQVAYNTEPTAIHKQDDHGFTPVYAAASTGNIHALRKLLDLGGGSDLTRCDNMDGFTPLEACMANMTLSREFSETLLSCWDGYDTCGLLCAATIRRILFPDNTTLTDEEYVAKRKWGCTCGQCLEGWLSPRMRFRIECEGEITYDHMGFMSDEFVRGEPLAADRFDLYIGLDFIPFELRSQVYKTFYRGYQSAFEAITHTMRQSIIPRPTAVRTAMFAGGYRGYDFFGHQAVQFFFSKGGLPDFALDCILTAISEQSPLGDGTFDETFEEELNKRPQCENDLEFNLVRQNLRLHPLAKGPFLEEERRMNVTAAGFGGLFEDEDEDEEEDDSSDGMSD